VPGVEGSAEHQEQQDHQRSDRATGQQTGQLTGPVRARGGWLGSPVCRSRAMVGGVLRTGAVLVAGRSRSVEALVVRPGEIRIGGALAFFFGAALVPVVGACRDRSVLRL